VYLAIGNGYNYTAGSYWIHRDPRACGVVAFRRCRNASDTVGMVFACVV